MRVALLGTIAVVLLSACVLPFRLGAPPYTADLFFDKTCQAPCVLGITPGVTSEAQARHVTETNANLTGCVAGDNTSIGGVRWIKCRGVVVVFWDDLVTQVGFDPPSLTVEQAIAQLGPPDAVDVLLTARPDEPARTKMVLLYDGIRGQLGLPEQNGAGFKLNAETQVVNVSYFDSQTYSTIRSESQQWLGYGAYPRH